MPLGAASSSLPYTMSRPASKNSFDPDLAYYASSPESTSYLARAHISLSNMSPPDTPQLLPGSANTVLRTPHSPQVHRPETSGGDPSVFREVEPNTPPPVPPKPRHTPGRDSQYSAYSDESSFSADVEPTQATRGRRASASSHNLLNQPSVVSLLHPSRQPSPIPNIAPPPQLTLDPGQLRPTSDASVLHRDSVASGHTDKIVDALARLPWAEPPPRVTPTTPSNSGFPTQYAPLSTASTPSFRDITFPANIMTTTPSDRSPSQSRPLPPLPSGGLGVPSQRSGSRTPTYSFLTSDPSQPGRDARSGQPLSRHSSRASLASIKSGGTPTHLKLPSISSHRSQAVWEEEDFPMSPSLAHNTDLYEEWQQQRPMSGYSGTAEIGPTPSPQSSSASGPAPSPYPPTFGHSNNPSPEGAFSPLSAQFTIPEVPTRSARSSVASAVRALSFSARSKSRNGRSARTKSIRSVKSTKSSRSKRGSTSTIGHRFGNKRWDWDKTVDGVPTLKVDGDADDWFDEMKKNEDMMDLLALVGRATVLERMLKKGKRISNASARYHGARASITSLHQRLQTARTPSLHPSAKRPSMISSRAPSRAGQTPGSSRSLRQRLSRRLKRTSTQEDMFTEIGSDDDEDDPSLFPAQDQSQPVPPSSYVRHAGARGIQASQDVVIFPERRGKPPPLPAKDIGLSCTQVVCLEPSSPTPLLTFPIDLGEADPEKGELRRSTTAAETEQGAECHPQSPHLGHRSPHWRNRQSVVSHLSTGQWDKLARRRWWIAVGVGIGLLVILIVALLAGLLARRQ